MGRRLRVTGAALMIAGVTGWLSVGAAMQAGGPSRTSVLAASLRVIGAKHPEGPFRNPDVMARDFIGLRERALLDAFPAEALDLGYHDALYEGLRRGIRQIIILGAGFDSRAHRFRPLFADARFIEVDQAPTQTYKRQRVQELLGGAPDVVRYVAMDFNKDDLLTRLKGAGYVEQERSFYIWEGVTMYLPETAIASTLRFVREHAAPGSLLAFDYTSADDPRVNNPSTRFAKLGEPWLYGFPGPSAVETLRKAGLESVMDESYGDLAATYARRPDGSSALPEQTDDQRKRRITIAEVPTGAK